jgi:type I restriction enzyme M protein
MIRSTAPVTGRMAVVLPHGALFRMGQEGKIRRQILEMDLLKALTESAGEFFFNEGHDVELKGISGSQRVHAVAWR